MVFQGEEDILERSFIYKYKIIYKSNNIMYKGCGDTTEFMHRDFLYIYILCVFVLIESP